VTATRAPAVELTSAERVLFPEAGVTKGDLFEYYRAVAPALLPHLRDRPFTMKRYPHGITGEVYFQKQVPRGAPAWIPTRQFTTYPRDGGSRQVDFALLNSSAAVLWAVQMNCIDMNAWYSRVDRPGRPDFVLFDLDPPDGGFTRAVRVAHLIRRLLDEVGLPGYVKTSGADGIHVLAPIVRRAGYERTYDFAERAARLLEARHPGLVTTEWLKRKRPPDAVLVDHRQNGWGKTIASVYSVRPRPRAPVSTPLDWEELDESLDPTQLGMREALERIERRGDLFAPVLEAKRPLAAAARSLDRVFRGSFDWNASSDRDRHLL
jgi:bifunctional non-homologous end joining protein LigD